MDSRPLPITECALFATRGPFIMMSACWSPDHDIKPSEEIGPSISRSQPRQAWFDSYAALSGRRKQEVDICGNVRSTTSMEMSSGRWKVNQCDHDRDTGKHNDQVDNCFSMYLSPVFLSSNLDLPLPFPLPNPVILLLPSDPILAINNPTHEHLLRTFHTGNITP